MFFFKGGGAWGCFGYNSSSLHLSVTAVTRQESTGEGRMLSCTGNAQFPVGFLLLAGGRKACWVPPKL